MIRACIKKTVAMRVRWFAGTGGWCITALAQSLSATVKPNNYPSFNNRLATLQTAKNTASLLSANDWRNAVQPHSIADCSPSPEDAHFSSTSQHLAPRSSANAGLRDIIQSPISIATLVSALDALSASDALDEEGRMVTRADKAWADAAGSSW